MKPINLCTLEVRVGKCDLNLKSDGLFAVSLEMGKSTSSLSPKKKIQNDFVAFNTTLRINIDKQLLEQQANPKCRVLLHLIRQSRQRQVIGVATLDIMSENNKGFKYHEFGQCADCEADIQVSVSYSSAFELGVKSQIGYFCANESRINDGNQMERSREKDSFIEDSIFDHSDFNPLSRSKAVSNVQWTSLNRPLRPSNYGKPRRSSNKKSIRKAKPSNLASQAPQEIITHYETEIKTLQDEIFQRDDWASGMKQMIQQLEAENQLLKEIRIDQLQLSNVQNLEQGIDFVSKLVHSKFQASRSAIYDSRVKSEEMVQSSSKQELTQDLKLQIKQPIKEHQNETQRTVAQLRSYKDVPQIIISPRLQCTTMNSQIQQRGESIESREELKNALKILTGGEKDQIITLEDVQIQDLQELLFKVRQEKQQLQDMTHELHQQLASSKEERDSYRHNLEQLQKQLDRVNLYSEQLAEENQRLREENLRFREESTSQEKSSQRENLQKIQANNTQLQEKNIQLERKLKQSLKAIEQFKNDALSAREELIIKEEEINTYRTKFGELASMTEVPLTDLKVKNGSQMKRDITVKQSQQNGDAKHMADSTTNASTSNLHQLYSVLLETSTTERKQLHHSLSQILSERALPTATVSSQTNSRNLKRLQLLINKLFIQIFKNNSQFKNIKEIETTKLQVSKQIENIIASN